MDQLLLVVLTVSEKERARSAPHVQMVVTLADLRVRVWGPAGLKPSH